MCSGGSALNATPGLLSRTARGSSVTPISAAISPQGGRTVRGLPFDIVRGQVWPAPHTDRVLPTAVIIERMVAGAEALLSNATSRFRLQADPGA